MNRRKFHKNLIKMGIGIPLISAGARRRDMSDRYVNNIYSSLPSKKFEVVIAGGGTAGVVAALAAARQGAKTALIEAKGYTGGTVTEGGTALHSFFNLPTLYPGVEMRQVVRGIPSEIVDRLVTIGGTSGHALMVMNPDYDPVSTVIDTELYKLLTMRMLDEDGVFMGLNTRVTDAVMDGSRIRGVIAESHQGREIIYAKSFVDCTGWGDLAAQAGADYTEPGDYSVSGGFGMGNVSVEGYHSFLSTPGSLSQKAIGRRSGEDEKIVRLHCDEWCNKGALPPEFFKRSQQIALSLVVTTIHDDYFMFIKVNYKMEGSPTNMDAVSKAELEIRNRQLKAVELFREYVPGCEKAFIARTSPHINARRVRCIKCDYDIKGSDVTEGIHFDDDTFVFGFHDSQPRVHVKNGGTFGIPYRAYLPVGIDNLFVTGMMITSEYKAFHSTRNTVSCMGMGQATGTAAALCAQKNLGTRDLPYPVLRETLEKGGVYFES